LQLDRSGRVRSDADGNLQGRWRRRNLLRGNPGDRVEHGDPCRIELRVEDGGKNLVLGRLHKYRREPGQRIVAGQAEEINRIPRRICPRATKLLDTKESWIVELRGDLLQPAVVDVRVDVTNVLVAPESWAEENPHIASSIGRTP